MRVKECSTLFTVFIVHKNLTQTACKQFRSLDLVIIVTHAARSVATAERPRVAPSSLITQFAFLHLLQNSATLSVGLLAG